MEMSTAATATGPSVRERALIAAAREARATALRGTQHDPELALKDHDERVPERDRPPPEGAGPAARLRPGRRPARRCRGTARRDRVGRALPRRGPPARRHVRGPARP